MAQTRAKKSVAAVANKTVAPVTAAKAKKTVTRKVRAQAQKAEAETIFSKPIEGFADMTNTVKTAAADAGEKITEVLKDVNVKAKDAFAKSGAVAKDVVEFHKANLEAVVESGKLAAKGTQTVAERALEAGRKNIEVATAHGKALTSVKAPADFFQLQTEFARKQFDAAVADFSKNTEFGLKLVGEVIAPIQNRYAVVVDQVKARMAA